MYMCVYMHVYMYVYVCIVCVYIYIYIYIHTHISALYGCARRKRCQVVQSRGRPGPGLGTESPPPSARGRRGASVC